MLLSDYFRGERIRGRVTDVYNTDKNHLEADLEADNGDRYIVRFNVGTKPKNLQDQSLNSELYLTISIPF